MTTEDSSDTGPEGSTDTDLAWTTLDSEIDYTCPGFEVRRDDVRLPDGTETDFHYVQESPSVVILPFTDDGDVVVIEEWRQAVGRINCGLPAGGMEPGEDIDAAAQRELAEETGYEAEVVESLATYEPSNGLFGSTFHYVAAHGCRPTAERELDFNESIRVRTTTFTDLLDRVTAGELRDGRSALAVLQYAQSHDQG
ncbi:MAG: NUDIX hydrolase [Natronomonas sp.]